MTYKQAAENGWQVRKAEKGASIEFWEVNAKAEEKAGEPSKGDNDESAKGSQRRLTHRVYTVSNANQIEGVPAHERPQPSAFEAVQRGERIFARLVRRFAEQATVSSLSWLCVHVDDEPHRSHSFAASSEAQPPSSMGIARSQNPPQFSRSDDAMSAFPIR